MAKRKYTRMGEKPTAYKCTNRKCGWEGKTENKKPVEIEYGMTELTCPECGNNDFYGLI